MEETKKCPYCGEEIMITAQKCRYCGEWLGNNKENAQPIYNTPPQQQPFHQQQPLQNNGRVRIKIRDKSKVVAGILAIFLGGIGVHHFYLGNILLGIIYLVFCWTFIPAIIAFIEGIIYLAKSDEEFDNKYNYSK